MQQLANGSERAQPGLMSGPESIGEKGGCPVFAGQPMGGDEARTIAGEIGMGEGRPGGMGTCPEGGWVPGTGQEKVGVSVTASPHPGSWSEQPAGGFSAAPPQGEGTGGYGAGAGYPPVHECEGMYPPPGESGVRRAFPGMGGPRSMPGGAPYHGVAPDYPGYQSAGYGTPPTGHQPLHMYGPRPPEQPHCCHHNGHPGQAPAGRAPWMDLVGDLANGNADPSRLMACLGSLDTQFWKGALVGVAATLLLTNDTVKSAIAGALSGVLGVFQPDAQEKES